MAFDVDPPPIPPRPHSVARYHHERPPYPPAALPPIPPLPPGFRPHEDGVHLPHSADPLLEPQSQRSIAVHPVAMTFALDERYGVSYDNAAHFTSPPQLPHQAQQQSINHIPGFIPPGDVSFRGQSPALPPPPLTQPLLPPGAAWHAGPPGDVGSVSALMATASLNNPPISRIQSVHGIVDFVEQSTLRPPLPSFPGERLLAAPLPSISMLRNALESVQSPTANFSNRVAWIRDVLLLISRASAAEGNTSSASASVVPLAPNTPPSGRIQITDPDLRRLADSAISLLVSIMPTLPGHEQKLPPSLAEALYIRAMLTASGAFPDYIRASLRNAFREFEMAARAGHMSAWFRLGRDYETFGDVAHARQCFERGMTGGDVSCIYRMGMAHLLGQLNLPVNSTEGIEQAAQLLHRAAMMATIDFPHPAYVFSRFLRAEFEQVSIPPHVLAAYVPAGSNTAHEARRHLERAAFLHFAPAQQRIGRAYEFAEDPFPYDPVLSMEFYSLASAGGDAQADLALSKWYLCGAEGVFEKDELRARECAERSAAHGLPAAKFAMGYYCEVGIGAPPDVPRAKKWYEEAAALGDTDAEGRLKALVDTSAPLSRKQHDTITETKLVRSRTQARLRSDTAVTSDATPSRQRTELQPRGQVYQRRQASLPSPIPPHNQNGPSVQAFHQQQQPRPAATLPPQPRGRRPYDIEHDSPPFLQQQQQQLTDRPRYYLEDPGVVPLPGSMSAPSGARRTASNGTPLPPTRRQYSGQSSMPNSRSPRSSPREAMSALPAETTRENPAPNMGGARYNTFAEMGIEGKRADDKECRIM